jgi:hypothetical protein
VSGSRDDICELEQRLGGIDTADDTTRVVGPAGHDDDDDDDEDEISHLHISHGDDSRVPSTRNSPR